jgi:hypothetical protein
MRSVLTLTLLLALATAHAQQTPSAARPAASPPVAPPPDQLEPAVDTRTSTAGQDAVPARPTSPPAAAAPTSSAPGAADAAPRGAAPKAAAAPEGAAAPAKGAARKGTDRVELETTDITGNRELPKVLYIVPWKRSDLGDLVGKPANSLLDQVLQPIDREVFLRENRYYDALKPDAAAPKAGAVQGSSDKP